VGPGVLGGPRWPQDAGPRAALRATVAPMADTASLPALPADPVTSIDEAVAVMASIAGALPATDGLACFNRMYQVVTEKVGSEVTTGFYSDPAFMTALDVAFFNLYLDAVIGFGAVPPTAALCWSELLADRTDPHIAPLQFALAGMNAHINHDLAIAVVRTCQDLGTAPDQGTHAADFAKVNTVLGSLDQGIRESFEQGVLLDLDRRAAGLENVVGNFSIGAAREVAWHDAQALWLLRHDAGLMRDYTEGLGAAAAVAGRALLVPRL